ncbi:hypothetical protein VNO78_02546 [Psophocarpus tetragonolobus]|uniref:Uncharacterized protein n=1 Tax=Psophocarpus tetragonolobus TaxID=3891 RepID=A0AAN9T026_PSOTE
MPESRNGLAELDSEQQVKRSVGCPCMSEAISFNEIHNCFIFCFSQVTLNGRQNREKKTSTWKCFSHFSQYHVSVTPLSVESEILGNYTPSNHVLKFCRSFFQPMHFAKQVN